MTQNEFDKLRKINFGITAVCALASISAHRTPNKAARIALVGVTVIGAIVTSAISAKMTEEIIKEQVEQCWKNHPPTTEEP